MSGGAPSRGRARQVHAELRRRREERARRRRRRAALLVLILLLLLLLRPCHEEPDPTIAQAEVVSASPRSVEVTPPPPELPTGQIPRRERPRFDPEPTDALPWLDAYRMQVAARGPRLAACFVGVPRPGALKWTASVEPRSGRVSDHALEPTLQSDPLTAAQRACALEVLAEPPYRLAPGELRSTPSRVSLAIEF